VYCRYTHAVNAARRDFVTTHWSLVLAAGADVSSSAAGDALAQLCETYWYPLYAFLRSRGHTAEDAQDLTQAFFARVLERRTLASADPARGRFRSFLLASLKNFAANEREREQAQKRGGGTSVVPLEIETAELRFQLEPRTDETPERVFDRQWALILLDTVLQQLQTEMTRAGRDGHFAQLKEFLTGENVSPGYAAAASALGMSEGATRVAVHRLRRRFAQLVRREIAQTVSSADEIDDELRYLRSSVSR
jgi:RNA polymerase sigma factor (sigma-70 family)